MSTTVKVIEHTVQQGDSPYKIALKYNTTENAIMKANPWIKDPKNLPIGSLVKIPVKPASGNAARGPVKPASEVIEHTVQQGDSPYKIALTYNTTESAIMKANPWIKDPKNLPIGSLVKIPVKPASGNASRGPVNVLPGFCEYRVQIKNVKVPDTFWGIAHKFQINQATLKKANPKINTNALQDGSALLIPIAEVPKPSEHIGISWKNTHQIVWNFFRKKEFSATATAGIMANLQQESEMDPTKKQYGGGPGRGLCQWEIGARWDQLLKYAWSQGKLPSALDTQLEYLWKELTELKETRWIRNFLDDYGGIGNLKKMNTYQAVIAFEESFERAGDPAYPRRFAYADQIYQKFASGVERARA
ncbi:phage tail tip lysozyme [Peribacillus simplex]|uniref:phage tail tip lysozyme n=1 Tax=Peribacillus simplex TaxID=1478 RepID=UPI003D2A4AC5